MVAIVEMPEDVVGVGEMEIEKLRKWSRGDVNQYIQPRGWFTLYESSMLPLPPVYKIEQNSLQACLPDEVILQILLRCSPAAVGNVACTCRQFRWLTRHDRIWRHFSLRAWKWWGKEHTIHTCIKEYKSCWWSMWVARPRLRWEGIYVARNTYIKPGMASWTHQPPCHIVVYYRYLRFYPDGYYLAKTSPDPVRKVANELYGRKSRPKHNVWYGEWTMDEGDVRTRHKYNNTQETNIEGHVRLRSTSEGANNRLDYQSLNATGDLDPVAAVEAAERGDHTGIKVDRCKNGMAPYSFVPFEEVDTHCLNNPPQIMDFYIA